MVCAAAGCSAMQCHLSKCCFCTTLCTTRLAACAPLRQSRPARSRAHTPASRYTSALDYKGDKLKHRRMGKDSRVPRRVSLPRTCFCLATLLDKLSLRSECPKTGPGNLAPWKILRNCVGREIGLAVLHLRGCHNCTQLRGHLSRYSTGSWIRKSLGAPCNARPLQPFLNGNPLQHCAPLKALLEMPRFP